MMAPLFFSCAHYSALTDALCTQSGAERGALHSHRFPDGEHYLRLDTPVDGRDVFIIGGTQNDSATLELFDLACAAVHYGARRLTLIIPYFGCSTMERAVKGGEAVTAKNRALLLSAVPPAAYGNRAFLVDLHSEGIPHYFGAAMRTVHIYAKPAISSAITQLGGEDFVLACTDAGRAKWVESLANDIGVDPSFVFKRRLDGERTEVTAVSAQVAGRTVVIYDDMIRTGGSLIGAARAYKSSGAKQIFAITTHGIFPGDALDRIRESELFERIISTDSHPRAAEVAAEHPDFLSVISLAGVLSAALREHP
ncbi:MAG: ribose-phosphate diphosphokinase [Myxococcota bacterium]|nr:ribose-phosphate diphosphokinase [Myxococcota bacterium]